jgi:hypothetical protein
MFSTPPDRHGYGRAARNAHRPGITAAEVT